MKYFSKEYILTSAFRNLQKSIYFMRQAAKISGTVKSITGMDPDGRRGWKSNGSMVSQCRSTTPCRAYDGDSRERAGKRLLCFALWHMEGRVRSENAGRMIEHDDMVIFPTEEAGSARWSMRLAARSLNMHAPTPTAKNPLSRHLPVRSTVKSSARS